MTSLVDNLSLPVRGAWIEILISLSVTHDTTCRSPCGERGLKCFSRMLFPLLVSRSPCGERGLKYFVLNHIFKCAVSLPVRGAWIEIINSYLLNPPKGCRSPCGERGLK